MAREHDAELAVGTSVGEYEIEARCAAGGHGTVYRGVHVTTGEVAAIKVLRKRFAESGKPPDRFLQELSALDKLDHPNVVRSIGGGALPDGRAYLLMQWLDGLTLSDTVRKNGPMSLAEVLQVMEQLCAALSAAHAVGIVHRDLKPSNLMIINRGSASDIVLLDFGIAKLLSPSENLALTESGEILGTPHWLSPEQVRSDRDVDQRADVYALGCIVYFLLTGRRPFARDSLDAVLLAHLVSPAPKVSDFAPVCEAVDRLVARCMEKCARSRFESVSEVLVALRDAANSDQGSLHVRCLQAVGVHVRVRSKDNGRDPSDESLDRIADLLDLAQERLVQAGLEVGLEMNDSFLAIGTLRAEAGHDTERICEVHELVERIVEDLAQARTDDLKMTIRTRIGDVNVEDALSGRRFRGGSLLRLHAWEEEHETQATLTAHH